MSRSIAPVEYQAMVGSHLGVSAWILIDQARVDQFAEATEDFQYIHIDRERALQSPFGGTIAHGFLLLSLCSKITVEVVPALTGARVIVNYGLNKVRFIHPARVGCRVRGHVRLIEVVERTQRQWLATHEVKMEIEGESKPAFVAEVLGLYFLG